MFYLINKPIGISSFQAIAKLRKILNIKKVGHTGTLDPLATGLLLVATENSTKLIQYLEKEHKTYVFSFNLDGFTETGDLGSEIRYLPEEQIEKVKKGLTKEKIENLLKEKFYGKISQIPPKYSAIKIDGQRAYSLARDGKEITMKSRNIEIFDYKLVCFDFPVISLEMAVSAGTYIRTIAEDIGKELGLNAYTTKLHRSKIGSIDESKSVNIEDLSEKNGIPYSELFKEFGEIIFDEQNIEKISRGLILENIFGMIEGKKYFIKNTSGEYISLVEVKENMVRVLANKIN